ncbi:MAG: hypothetical protein FJX74_00695 [Armatimonadetes bacterium]|nr:hypothetical protein [Armatimonadota bacterium]
MRLSAGLTPVILVGAVLSCLVAGCSGPGTPAEPAELRELRDAAADHVTTVLLVKRWFAILYARQETVLGGGAADAQACIPEWVQLPPEPGDPSGLERWRGTMSDCTVIDLVRDKWTGAGYQTFHYPDGRTKTVTFQSVDGGQYNAHTVEETLWDGAQLVYERGIDPYSRKQEQYERGTATLPDGRSIAFLHLRNTDRDVLELDPDDGSRLEIRVPLTGTLASPFEPLLAKGASGTYESPSGDRQTFWLWGEAGTRWDRWALEARGGVTGGFTVEADFSGAGALRREGAALGVLRWQSTGEGRLEPVGAAAIQVAPSAAARDFQIDQWIGNIAAMGPMPLY